MLQAYHQYSVSTIITGSYSYQFFVFVPHCCIALHWSSFESLRLPLAKGSSTSNQAFLLRRKDVTALRCSEPLRYRVGGPSKVFAIFCGMGPPGYNLLIGSHRMAAGWDHHFCSSLQYRSALVVARMRNICFILLLIGLPLGRYPSRV